jgi:hypothetical protein
MIAVDQSSFGLGSVSTVWKPTRENESPGQEIETEALHCEAQASNSSHPNALFERYSSEGHQSGGKDMLKAPLIAAFLASVAFSPAFAQDLCNDAHMKQMDGMIAKMTDPAQQKKATTALDQSKAAMKAGNNAECMKYMNEAHKAMGM